MLTFHPSTVTVPQASGESRGLEIKKDTQTNKLWLEQVLLTCGSWKQLFVGSAYVKVKSNFWSTDVKMSPMVHIACPNNDICWEYGNLVWITELFFTGIKSRHFMFRPLIPLLFLCPWHQTLLISNESSHSLFLLGTPQWSENMGRSFAEDIQRKHMIT